MRALAGYCGERRGCRLGAGRRVCEGGEEDVGTLSFDVRHLAVDGSGEPPCTRKKCPVCVT
jgi:hypothetical protein